MSISRRKSLHNLAHETQSCRLLNLPAELRNYIWTVAFTHAADSAEDAIDILRAKAPSTALLSICHQIHDEAAGIYAEAYARYWNIGNFVLDTSISADSCTECGIKSLRDTDLKEVKKLSIRGLKRDFVFDDGVCRSDTRRTGPMRILVPPLRRVAIPEEQYIGKYELKDKTTNEGTELIKFADGCNVEAAKEAAGWCGLTNREISAMLMLYRLVPSH